MQNKIEELEKKIEELELKLVSIGDIAIANWDDLVELIKRLITVKKENNLK